ncbi:MAG TPA: flagellar biosynthesis protein FlhB [Pirellulaceae bacterium]|nr:flagellar biosynthesis protein FlhB [Pirellulaceae bacterium]
MADEASQDQKTEEPTPRRLEKALEEGQIAFSSELLSGLTLLAGVVFFLVFGAWFMSVLKGIVRERLTFFEPMMLYPESILLAIRRDVGQAALALGALIVPITVVILASAFLQTRFNLTTKPLRLNWKKLSPMTGMKRLFSMRAVVKGLVSLAKAACIVAAAVWLTRSQLGDVAASGQSTLEQAVTIGGSLVLAIGLLASALMVFVGLGDYGFQWWKQRQELRMTNQELRDEFKEMDGDPQIKARIKRVANELSKKRMINAVPTATVVVTNPTHFAVALRYEPDQTPAPVVVAKGADYLAQQIIAKAKEHSVAIVERKDVARYLYANVKVGQEIPYELFQAVAEILSFIRRLEQSAA